MTKPLTTLVLAELEQNGPSTPLAVTKRLGRRNSRDVWRILLRLARSGQIIFDTTGRIAQLPPATEEPAP